MRDGEGSGRVSSPVVCSVWSMRSLSTSAHANRQSRGEEREEDRASNFLSWNFAETSTPDCYSSSSIHTVYSESDRIKTAALTEKSAIVPPEPVLFPLPSFIAPLSPSFLFVMSAMRPVSYDARLKMIVSRIVRRLAFISLNSSCVSSQESISSYSYLSWQSLSSPNTSGLCPNSALVFARYPIGLERRISEF